MMSHTTKPDSSQPTAEMAFELFDNWFDAIETAVRARAREFIEELIRGELDTVLGRPRYGRSQMAGDEESADVTGHRHGSRPRSLTGTFGPIEIAVPRARLNTTDGKTTEWKSKTLRAYQRRTLAADALIAGAYLAGTNTRRVRRALAALFGGAVGKDTVSRVWRKVQTDWDAWNARSLAEEPIVRLILDGTGCACGSTARRPRSRCSLSSACARMGKRCCSQSKAWAEKAPRLGALSSTISSSAGCGGPSFSSSMARRGSTRPSPPSGTEYRCNAARFTSTETCSHMHPSACMTRSPRITTT
jgi:hypothetical protein